MLPKKTHCYQDDDLVSLSMVYELLDQQQFFYKELIEQQERNFKTFLQMLVDSINSRIDNVVKEVQDMKNGLHVTKTELVDVRRQGNINAKRAECLAEGLVIVREAMNALSSKAGVFDGKPKKGNLCLGGKPDARKADTWQDQPKAKKLVADLTDLHFGEFQVPKLYYALCMNDRGAETGCVMRGDAGGV